MIKHFLYILLALLCLASCTENDSPLEEKGTYGSIYGIITDSETAEPIRGATIELYTIGINGYKSSLLLKTVAYDDGHYEFDDIEPGVYILTVDASGYNSENYRVEVLKGKIARADMQLDKIDTGMTVTTFEPTVTNVNKVTFNGRYDRKTYVPTEYGFIYGQIEQIDVNNGQIVKGQYHNASSGPNFSADVTNLEKGVWYVRAYAKNEIGYEYGISIMFEISGIPAVETLSATNVTGTTATLNGEVVYEGNPRYTEKGFVYSSSFHNPTVDDPDEATIKVPVIGNSKEFSANISGLSAKKQYFVRAYIKNEQGVAYGSVVPFIFDDSGYITLASEGLMVQVVDLSSGATWDDANKLCEASRVGNFNDWRLPTLGECQALAAYVSQLKLNTTQNYWTSTVFSSYQYYYYNFGSKSYGYRYDDETYRVRAVRNIN